MTMAAAPAGAQVSDEFLTQARARLGPLYLKPSFSLDRFGIETNVFSEPVPQRDFVVSATPRVDAWVPFQRRALLSTTFIAGSDWYAEHAGERSFNPEFRYEFAVPWRRVTATVGGGHLRTRRRPDFEIDVRSNRFRRDLQGGLAVQAFSTVQVDLQVRQRSVGFDGDAFLEGTYLSETLNRKERSGVVAVRWRRTALTTFVFETELRAARFLRSPDRDSDNLIVMAGADLHPRALVTGSGRIGVRRFESLGSAVSDITSVVAQAELSYRVSENSAVTFTAERDVNYSFRRVAPYFVLNQLGLSVTHRLTRQFDLRGSATRTLYDYRSVRAGRDSAWFLNGEVGYLLNATTRIGLQAGYIKRHSTTIARRRWDGLVLGLVLDYDI